MPFAENKLLRSLPDTEADQLRFGGERVDFKPNQILHDAGAAAESVYFVESGSISVLVVLSDRSTIEAGFVGREGIVGSAYDTDSGCHFTRAIAITDGAALRVPIASYKRVLTQSPMLRQLVHQNNVKLAQRAQQIAACNLKHRLEARLCRWLLQTIDNSGSPVINITQDTLAEMLGVNRARLSETLKALETLGGLGESKRGAVHVIDFEQIKARTCECFDVLCSENAARECS